MQKIGKICTCQTTSQPFWRNCYMTLSNLFQVIYRIAGLKSFSRFIMGCRSFLSKVTDLTTLLKRNSITSVFLWILQNISSHIFKMELFAKIVKGVNYFCKKLHLRRLTRFWRRLCVLQKNIRANFTSMKLFPMIIFKTFFIFEYPGIIVIFSSSEFCTFLLQVLNKFTLIEVNLH